MRTATITEAKNQLSALLDRVRAGETVVITDRGRPVARVVPATTATDGGGRVERLVRAGVVRRGEPGPLLDRLASGAPRVTEGGSAVQAILDERRDGR